MQKVAGQRVVPLLAPLLPALRLVLRLRAQAAQLAAVAAVDIKRRRPPPGSPSPVGLTSLLLLRPAKLEVARRVKQIMKGSRQQPVQTPPSTTVLHTPRHTLLK